MKKAEWLIVIFIMSMGMMCLFVSATSFRSETITYYLRWGARIGVLLISAVLISGFVHFLIKKYKK
ncbi:hypothetical protein [Paenibacillus sp. BAC0078]